MRLVWSPEARNDLREIYLFISEDNPYAARSLQGLIRERVEHLRDNPYVGRPGRVPGTRELVISGTRYIVPYRAVGDTLHILRVYHGARQWPEGFG